MKWTKCAALRFVFLPAAILLTAACRQEAPTTGSGPGAQPRQAGSVVTFAGQGRDRLCLAEDGGKVGFITFAEGSQANCSVRGSWSSSGPQAIQPDGDASCSIIFNRDERSVTLVKGGPGCAYYCGPGASFEGKTFVRMEKAEPVTDIAGDPLC